MAVDQETFVQLKDAISRFVRERLVPNEDRIENEDDIPAEILREMREIGLYGLSIPEEYGGIGLSMSQEAEIVFELGQTSLAFRSAVGTNIGIGSQGIVIDGTEEQKKYWLPKLAEGMTASFALTEPEVGSDAASVKTVAVRDGDDYLITGTKRYITNAVRAGVFTVMARSEPDKKGADGISSFIVPADTPGITLGKIDKKMGQRGTKTCDVIFDKCRVPASSIIGGKPGMGFRTAMKVLDRGRLHISALSCGMAERLIRDALAYAADRKQFGAPIVSFQLVQAMLADSRTEAMAARALVRDTARKFDAREPTSMEAACCKLFATEMVGRVADRAVQIHGGAGYMAEYKVERFYRDVRLLRIYEGTTQIQQIVIARNMLKQLQG